LESLEPILHRIGSRKEQIVIAEHNIMLWNGVILFILAIESHEVAVIEYDHLRKFIQFRVDDAQKAIERFRSFIQKIDIEH
jgi:hypothetical protein